MRVVKPDRVNDFKEWVKSVNNAVKEFEGYLGSDLIRPRDQFHPEYVIVLRFDKYEHLRAWMGSPEREKSVKRLEDMTDGEVHQKTHGFEPCFILPDPSVSLTPPAKYKMALLTMLAIYPPLLAVSTLIQFLLHGWPRALLILLTVLLLVPAMIYYIMPWVTRLFRSWLYPEAAPSQQLTGVDPARRMSKSARD